MTTISVFTTEAISTKFLPVAYRPTSAPVTMTHKSMGILNIGDRTQGEWVHFDARGECTNPYKFYVMVGTYLAYNINGAPIIQFVKPMATNITPEIHHGITSMSGSFIVPSNGNYNLYLMAYCATGSGTARYVSPRNMITDYVDLTGTVILP